MPHRLARARWSFRRELAWRISRMQRNGMWLLAVLGAVDFELHLMAHLEPHVALYEVIRTIVLDGEASLWDTPETPFWLRGALWTLRLALPALAGGAILDVVSRMMPEPLEAPGWMEDHTIIVGAGRLGYRVAMELVRRGEPVVVVNLNEEGDGLRRLRELEGVTTLIGDAREGYMLQRAGIERAARLVAVTGSDVVNLSVSLLALDPSIGAGDLKAWAHVFDHRLEDLPGHLDPGGVPRLGTFSLYRDAAVHFCQGRCRKGDWTRAIVAGYGRFGHAMVEALHAQRGPDFPVVVLDRDPRPEEAESLTYIRGDLLSGRTFDRLRPHLDGADRVLCVVCTDSDAANLAFALRLREALSDAEVTVFTRLFEWPDSMHAAGFLGDIQPLELWDEAGMAVVNRVMGSVRERTT